MAAADFIRDIFQSHHLVAGGTPLAATSATKDSTAATIALLKRKGFHTKQSLVRANISYAELLQHNIGVKEANAIVTAVAHSRRRLRSQMRRMPAEQRSKMKQMETELATREAAFRQTQRQQLQEQENQQNEDEVQAGGSTSLVDVSLSSGGIPVLSNFTSKHNIPGAFPSTQW